MVNLAPSTDFLTALPGRFRAGEGQALIELYDMTGPYVYRLALRITDSADFAADVTEDVFSRLWSRPEGLAGVGAPLVRVLGEMVHERATYLCDQRADGPAEGRGVGRTSEAAASVWRHILEALPGADRDAVELIWLGGHSLTAGADALRRSVVDVAASLQRGMQAVVAHGTT